MPELLAVVLLAFVIAVALVERRLHRDSDRRGVSTFTGERRGVPPTLR